ncbi:MAG: cell division protein FtsB [Xanthomonadales bacterium]|nr:cell division protein FtsB [Xanthomonadales bacterium]
MKVIIAILLLVLVALQFKLWFGDGGFSDISGLEQRVAAQEAENEQLEERNSALRAEVEDLRERLDAVEERARSELGLTREGEEFYQVVPKAEPGDRPRDESRPRDPDGSN